MKRIQYSKLCTNKFLQQYLELTSQTDPDVSPRSKRSCDNFGASQYEEVWQELARNSGETLELTGAESQVTWRRHLPRFLASKVEVNLTRIVPLLVVFLDKFEVI